MLEKIISREGKHGRWLSRIGRTLAYPLTTIAALSCSDNIGPSKSAPEWQPIPTTQIAEDTSLSSIPTINLEQYAKDAQTPSNELSYAILSQSNPALIRLQFVNNMLVPTELQADSSGTNILALTVTDTEGLADTIEARYVVNPRADVTFNLRDMLPDGEPLITTPSRLIVGTRQIDVSSGTTRVQLEPGTHNITFENPNYWSYWLIIRKQGSTTNLEQRDSGYHTPDPRDTQIPADETSFVGIGLDDMVLELYKIPRSFHMVGFLDNIVEVADPRGSQPWNPNLSLRVVADTRPATGSGIPPSQESLDAIRRVALEYLPRVRKIGGIRVYNGITYEERNDNPRPGEPRPEGMLTVIARDDIPGLANNAADIANGYTVGGFVWYHTNVDAVNIFLKEMVESNNNLTSARHDTTTQYVPNTIFQTGGRADFAPEDLALLKIINSFNAGTYYRPATVTGTSANNVPAQVTRQPVLERIAQTPTQSANFSYRSSGSLREHFYNAIGNAILDLKF